MTKKNMTVRTAAREKGVKLWQIADKIGLHQSNLSCLLRYELTDEEKGKFLQVIDEIAKECE